MIYITGDIHGDIAPVEAFLYTHTLTKDDYLIFLGDVGLNYYFERRPTEDYVKKSWLSDIIGDATALCIQGNHEERPLSVWVRDEDGKKVCPYKEKEWMGGHVFYEDNLENILFLRDGDCFTIDNKTFLVLGGAYSVDKYWRLQNRWAWFADEQMSEKDKARAMETIAAYEGKFDYILSHSCPYSMEPTDMFLEGVDQSTVDTSTEEFLDKVKEQCTYKEWFCGHWHIDRKVNGLHFLFNEWVEVV